MTCWEASALQRSGVRLLAAGGVLGTIVLGLIGVALGSANTAIVLALAVAANVCPLLAAAAGRRDATARMTVGTLAATMPALLVLLLEGHPWQMDGHMYFFVALAALTVLCDWRPIALAAGLIALHHLVLVVLAPAAVFSGSGHLSRVSIHALAVVLQLSVLCYLTVNLRRLIEGQAAARLESERLAALADSERATAVSALEKARLAETTAAAERAQREALERAVTLTRERELLALADKFEGTVREVAVGLESASTRLESSARNLNVIAAQTGREASDVAEGAAQASVAAQAVAGAVRELTASIALVSANAEQQSHMTLLVEDSTRGGDSSVRQLAERARDIGSFVGEINAIASRTNLLALNATIEAARAGEAGRGFAVVAGEVKTLAGQATQATHKIGDMIAAVGSGVEAAVTSFRDAAAAVGEMSHTASAIQESVAAQRGAAARIEASAEQAATRAEMIEARIGHVADAANAAGALSLDVREASTLLSGHVRELRCSADRFVGHLRERGAEAA